MIVVQHHAVIEQPVESVFAESLSVATHTASLRHSGEEVLSAPPRDVLALWTR